MKVYILTEWHDAECPGRDKDGKAHVWVRHHPQPRPSWSSERAAKVDAVIKPANDPADLAITEQERDAGLLRERF